MFMDEKIAKLEKAKKALEKAKNTSSKSDKVNEEESELTQEEVNNAINSGLLEIENKKFEFTKKTLLGGNIQIPMIEKYFELVLDTDEIFALKHEQEGVSIMFNATPLKNKINDENFKKGMEQNFKNMELYIEWIEEGDVQVEENNIKYYTFFTPTALGMVYNLVFFYSIKNKIIIGNFNCPNKDVKVWEKIFKGMVELITI